MNDIDFLKSQFNRETQLELAKALDSTSGFSGYNLEPEAALLLPFFAGWRARVPSDKAAQGATQATWKIQNGYGGADAGAWGSSEKSTGTASAPSTIQFQAPYLQQAFNGDVSYMSMLMSQGFDDPMNVETSNVLSLLLMREELIGIGGNYAALGVPAPTAQPSTMTSPATFAAGTWHIKATAITLEGAVNNATSNSTIGESNSSASIAIVVPSGGVTFLDVAIPAVPGAVGYKIYAEHAAGGGIFYLCDPTTTLNYRKITSGTTDLTALGDPIVPTTTGQTFVGVDHVQIYAIPPNTQPTAPTSDHSVNALTYEGLFAWASKTTVYGNSGLTHNNIDMNGAPFTTVGTGVKEIDAILQYQWQVNKMSPSLIMGSPATVKSISNAIVKQANVPTYWVDISQRQGNFQGGVFMGGYTNSFVGTMIPGSEPMIPVWSHPYLTDGNLLIVSENIPSATYRYSRKGKAFSLETLAPYTYWPLARTDLSVPFAIFWSQTLKCHHPGAQSVIQGARVDQ